MVSIANKHSRKEHVFLADINAHFDTNTIPSGEHLVSVL